MGQISLVATLTAAPAQATDQTFPSGTTTIPFATTPDPKTYTNDTGRNNVSNFASPSSYTALAGLGTAGPVTQAHTLYVRTANPMMMQLTFQGGSALDPIQIQGVFFMEFPPNLPLVLVEMQGVGAIEYYFAGNL
jgi:hypothetical protein